jgi:hypothetical protein
LSQSLAFLAEEDARLKKRLTEAKNNVKIIVESRLQKEDTR